MIALLKKTVVEELNNFAISPNFSIFWRVGGLMEPTLWADKIEENVLKISGEHESINFKSLFLEKRNFESHSTRTRGTVIYYYIIYVVLLSQPVVCGYPVVTENQVKTPMALLRCILLTPMATNGSKARILSVDQPRLWKINR